MKALALLLALVPLAARPQVTIVQGLNSSGQSAVGKPVEIGGVDADGKVRPIKVGNDGTVQMSGGAGGLTDTQLRASSVSVSASALPLPAGASTEATLGTVVTNTGRVPSGLTAPTAPPAGTEAGLIVRNIPSGTQPVSAATLPLPAGASSESTLGTRLADSTFTGRVPSGMTAPTSAPAGTEAGLITRNIPSGTQTIAGAVTANVGATNGLALDATLTGGTQKTQIVNGANALAVDSSGRPTVNVNGTVAVNGSAAVGAVNSEQCVTNSAGGTTISVPAGTRSFELQNLGPNPAFCTLDGQSPVANSLGHRIAGLTAGIDKVADAWSVDILAAVATLKCIAASAAQSTGACLQFTVVK